MKKLIGFVILVSLMLGCSSNSKLSDYPYFGSMCLTDKNGYDNFVQGHFAYDPKTHVITSYPLDMAKLKDSEVCEVVDYDRGK